MAIDVTSINTGCWIDGHWGIYSLQRLVEIANDFGFDGEVLKEGWTFDPSTHEAAIEEAERAESWLADNLPDGYVCNWYDGEFFVNHVSEVDNDIA